MRTGLKTAGSRVAHIMLQPSLKAAAEDCSVKVVLVRKHVGNLNVL